MYAAMRKSHLPERDYICVTAQAMMLIDGELNSDVSTLYAAPGMRTRRFKVFSRF